MDEVDVHAVDLRRELRECVQPHSGPPQVVAGHPVGGELSNRRQLHALRPILDELFRGQARRLDAASQVFHRLFLNVELERTDLDCSLDSCHAHLSVVGSTASSWSRRTTATRSKFRRGRRTTKTWRTIQKRRSQDSRCESMPFTTSVQIPSSSGSGQGGGTSLARRRLSRKRSASRLGLWTDLQPGERGS